MTDIQAIDLFCGAGGMACGLRAAGIDVRLGVDTDPAGRYPYLRHGGEAYAERPVEGLPGALMAAVFRRGAVRLLVACPPCQTYSTYARHAHEADHRWQLLGEVGRLAGEVRPDLLVVENVPQLACRPEFATFVEGLGSAGYHVSHEVVACHDYGVPQSRRRLILMASRLGPICMPPPSEAARRRSTVRDAIGHLPPVHAGEVCPGDRLHHPASLTDLNMERIRASRPGGTWRDWPDPLRLPCHRRITGAGYGGVYGRMEWDAPAPTITTQFFGYGNGRHGHPEQDRALSLREGALLQTFPGDYTFVAPGSRISRAKVGRMVGNAVPPLIAQVIGGALVAHVASTRGEAKSCAK